MYPPVSAEGGLKKGMHIDFLMFGGGDFMIKGEGLMSTTVG